MSLSLAHRLVRATALAWIVFLSSRASAQADTARRPDSTARRSTAPDLGPLRTIEFDTDEGTYLSLDVSPDGRTIVFDMLGDLYVVPIEGGAARAITSGLPWDQQPRWSPDGKRIAFVSDRDGATNLWIVNADGTGARQLSRERKDTFISPAWLPDGPAIIVRRNMWGGTGSDLFAYFPDGGGSMRLAETGRLGSNAVASPDGRYIYFSQTQIMRYDRQSTLTTPMTSTARNMRPQLSRDGSLLAYVRKTDARSDLRVREIATGRDRLVGNLWTEEIGSSANSGDYPSYSFTPDGRTIVIWAHGKIQRYDTATGASSPIPITVHVTRQVAERITRPRRITEDSVRARILRWQRISPDGRQLVFSSLAKVWIMDLPNGTPRRLTTSTEGEYAPAFSPDGRSIVYTTWTDSLAGGHIRVAPAQGGASRQVTTLAGQYLNPAWSPDGSKIAYVVGNPIPEQIAWQPNETNPYELRWIPTSGGESVHLTQVPVPNWPERSHPTLSFSPDGSRVYFTEMLTGPNARSRRSLVSIRLDGSDRVTHLRFPPGDEAVLSPDGRRVALTRGDNVYVTYVPLYSGLTLDYEFEGGPLPTLRITRDGGDFPQWLNDTTLSWSSGTKVYRRTFAGTGIVASDTLSRPQVVADVKLVVPRYVPKGVIAFTNARLITMKGQEVIDRGTIVVTGDRITAVGRDVRVPAGATVMNASGKTILPGFHDGHAHMQFNPYGTYPDQKWPNIVNLAYGVTAALDPWNPSHEIFDQSDMVDAGLLLGPRVFSTGTWIDGRRAELPQFIEIRGIDDARSIVRRLKALGADYLKEYMQPRRDARQWIAQAAREEGVPLTAEGAGDWVRNLTNVIDGFTAFEHTLPVAPLYKDVVELIARSGIYYTPTLMVTYGGEALNNYFYGLTNPHDDPKVRRFTPEERMDEGRRWISVPDEELFFKQISRDLIKVDKAGGLVVLGAHGNRQGIGVHWELWGKVLGGATPWQALRDATLRPAQKMGLERDLGSLEPGKLADFIVLDKDPLANIRNTDAIRFVVKGGAVYDAASMAQVWPERKELHRFFWESDEEWQKYRIPPRTEVPRPR